MNRFQDKAGRFHAHLFPVAFHRPRFAVFVLIPLWQLSPIVKSYMNSLLVWACGWSTRKQDLKLFSLCAEAERDIE